MYAVPFQVGFIVGLGVDGIDPTLFSWGIRQAVCFEDLFVDVDKLSLFLFFNGLDHRIAIDQTVSSFLQLSNIHGAARILVLLVGSLEGSASRLAHR